MNVFKLTFPVIATIGIASTSALILGAQPVSAESHATAPKTEAPAEGMKKDGDAKAAEMKKDGDAEPKATEKKADKKAEAPEPAPVAPPKTDWTPDDITEMVMGNADAPVTIIEYASFTCPHCANFHKNQLKELKKEYVDTGKVKVIYRDVFFDRIGLWASLVARCDTGKFFGVADLVYNQQGEWLNSRDPVVLAGNLRKLGIVAGLDAAQVDACMQDASKAKALYDWYQANQKADDIQSTPTLLINGKKHSNMAYDELKKLIDAELGG